MKMALSLLGVLCLGAALTALAAADERTDFYLEMQQREECADLGGRLDGNKCYLPPEMRSEERGRVFVKNPNGGCSARVAIAYVKPGDTKYTVDGWWTIAPTYWGGTDLWGSDDKPILHDGSFPLYYGLKTEAGEPVTHNRFRIDKTFILGTETIPMAPTPYGLIDGGYWLEVFYC